MAMRTASPWWASLTFGIGLLFMFTGERLFGHSPGVRMVMTGAGLVGVLGVTGLRAFTAVATTGARRNVERALLYCQLLVLFGLLLYALSTNWGLSHFHLSEKGADKLETSLRVLYAIVMIVGLVPMFMIETSLGIALRTAIEIQGGNDEGIEYMRVRDVGLSGLSIGLALAFVMVTCNVANDRNIQRDVSYFKTSSPGDSTIKIVQAQTEQVKVLLFFPPSNEVGSQVRDYFSALASAAGHLTIEEHDQARDAELAGKYKVTKDGVVVIIKGSGDKERSQNIELETDLEKARKGTSKLRTFDREVNSALLKVVREKRKIYLTSGHGEITHPESIPPDLKGKVPERHTMAFKARLPTLNYEVKDLGFSDLTKDVPDDATLVMMLAPTIPLQSSEWAALDRYLDKGGRLLIALDPKGDPSLGPLEGKLGLKYNPAPLTDDQSYMRQRGTAIDRRFVVTTSYSAHASTTSLSRAAKGLVLVESGALEDAPFSSTKDQPKKTITIRSNETSWLDLNDNFTFDAATEKRQRWNIAAAVEGPKMKGPDGKDRDGWRALVFADADVFTDALVEVAGQRGIIMVAQYGGGDILDDSVKWLGGEEVFAGEVVSEEDKPIPHTKDKDAVWFTLTIIGMPLLVLALGLVGTLTRRRKRTKVTQEVKS
jgi:gliding motility-associatede transport system auxiliary component